MMDLKYEMEVEYFCKPASGFDISKLDLSEEELKYVTMACKSPRYLVCMVRGSCAGRRVLTDRIYDVLEREGRVRNKRDSYLKAEEISGCIYDEIYRAGYFRTGSFRAEKAILFRGILTPCLDWSSHGLNNKLDGTDIMGSSSDWLEESGLDDRRETMRLLRDTLRSPIPQWRLHNHKPYDPEKIEDAVTEIMRIILTPKQREIISWVADAKIRDVNTICTKEEYNLYRTAMCAIIANIYEIDCMIDCAFQGCDIRQLGWWRYNYDQLI